MWILQTVGRIPWMGGQPVTRLLPTQDNTNTDTSMPQVGLEPMIPVFERTKTFCALDCAAAAIGYFTAFCVIFTNSVHYCIQVVV
jgi:hypothetical protein